MTLDEIKKAKNPPIHTLSTTLSDKQAICYLDNNPDMANKLDAEDGDKIEKAKNHWRNFGLFEMGTENEKKSPFMCDDADEGDNANNNSNNTNNNFNNILTNNPIQNIVNSPGISNIRELGEKWSDGIRSIVFRYKNKDGEYKEISSNKKSFEFKCLEQKRFLNQPYKLNNNRGNKWRKDADGNKIKGQDAETVVDNLIYTANLCKNGNYDQNFYLTNDYDGKFVESDIYDNIESEHIHFHRHSYDLVHDELENINDI